MEQGAYTDEELIQKLKNGGKEFEDISLYMFHEYKGFVPEVKEKLLLTQQNLQHTYAESLVVLIRHIIDGTLKDGELISEYFNSLFYNSSVQLQSRIANKLPQLMSESLGHDAKERVLLKLANSDEQGMQVVKVIDSMGDLCKRVLKDWGYYRYSMEGIAKRSNLNNAASAENTKNKCLKNIRELLNAKIYQV